MDTTETFGQRMERLITHKNISQKQLAFDTEIGQSRLSEIINDKALPTLQQLAKIAKAIDVSQAVLLGEESPAINNSFNGQKLNNSQNVLHGSNHISGITDEHYKNLLDAKDETISALREQIQTQQVLLKYFDK